MEEAVEMAQLDECVRRLAYGLETEIGDNGFALRCVSSRLAFCWGT